jgi:hypothetical protein
MLGYVLELYTRCCTKLHLLSDDVLLFFVVVVPIASVLYV